MIRKLDEELAEHERIGYRQGVAEERARIYRELMDALTVWTGGCRPDSYRVDVARHLYTELDRICPKPPSMTDLMVSPESTTPEPEMLEDVPAIQTADPREAFEGQDQAQGPEPDCPAFVNALWPDELDDVFRRRRDQSAERYTREDGSPK